jgi:hypothetical protein
MWRMMRHAIGDPERRSAPQAHGRDRVESAISRRPLPVAAILDQIKADSRISPTIQFAWIPFSSPVAEASAPSAKSPSGCASSLV